MRILITAAGTGTAYQYVVTISKYFPELEIVTGDINEQCFVTAALFSKIHIVTPIFNPNNYLNYLNNQIGKLKIDYYLPILDTEIVFASEMKNFIECEVLTNSFEFCKLAISKNNYDVFTNNSAVNEVKQISYADFTKSNLAIAKKNAGFGGNGTLVKNNKNNVLIENSDDWFYYEYINGKEYTIDSFPLLNKATAICSVRERFEVKNGVSTKAIIQKKEKLQSFSDSLVNKFNLIHPFCFQVKEDENGKFFLIDMNPRLGAGSSMSSINGTNFFAAHIAFVLGENYENHLNKIYESCIVTRQYVDFLNQIQN